MRLLTYNIHKGIGGRDRRYRLQRVMEVIAAEQPDLILLQEVDRHVRRSSFDDQPRLLARHFDLPGHLYQQNVKLKDGGYGNLMLSRWPMVSHHQISLRLRQRKPRGAQIAVLETPAGRLRTVNFHLGLSEKERHWQIGHLLSHPLFLESDGLPTILAGDYNDWRNTLQQGELSRQGYRQVTSPISRFRSFPAWLALGSLDKVFIHGPLQIHRAHIVRSQAARAASDHLPLVVELEMGGKDEV
ncbi:MAG: endonuclease/exonuclease/phosphatase family protein [Pirellulales bacterium]